MSRPESEACRRNSSACREASSLGIPCPCVSEPHVANHEHKWQFQQNVTSRGYVMPAYRFCRLCGEAEVVQP